MSNKYDKLTAFTLTSIMHFENIALLLLINVTQYYDNIINVKKIVLHIYCSIATIFSVTILFLLRHFIANTYSSKLIFNHIGILMETCKTKTGAVLSTDITNVDLPLVL